MTILRNIFIYTTILGIDALETDDYFKIIVDGNEVHTFITDKTSINDPSSLDKPMLCGWAGA